MKIDMNYKIREIDGKILKERVPDLDKDGNPKRDVQLIPILKTGDPMTLKKLCVRVLVNPPSPGIDKTTGLEKETEAVKNVGYAILAERIYKSNGLIELDADEIVLLKNFINKKYNRNPLIVKQCREILDPTEDPRDKKKD